MSARSGRAKIKIKFNKLTLVNYVLYNFKIRLGGRKVGGIPARLREAGLINWSGIKPQYDFTSQLWSAQCTLQVILQYKKLEKVEKI